MAARGLPRAHETSAQDRRRLRFLVKVRSAEAGPAVPSHGKQSVLVPEVPATDRRGPSAAGRPATNATLKAEHGLQCCSSHCRPDACGCASHPLPGISGARESRQALERSGSVAPLRFDLGLGKRG